MLIGGLAISSNAGHGNLADGVNCVLSLDCFGGFDYAVQANARAIESTFICLNHDARADHLIAFGSTVAAATVILRYLEIELNLPRWELPNPALGDFDFLYVHATSLSSSGTTLSL
jgi:hypothetical protein